MGRGSLGSLWGEGSLRGGGSLWRGAIKGRGHYGGGVLVSSCSLLFQRIHSNNC